MKNSVKKTDIKNKTILKNEKVEIQGREMIVKFDKKNIRKSKENDKIKTNNQIKKKKEEKRRKKKKKWINK